jgi:glyoxylase-like metal-dependent hydrolase (beta-lactamase superfamily II)
MQGPPQPWPTGKVEQVEEKVGRVLAPNPSPFTYTGTQSYIVGGDDGIAVIDPGPMEEAHLDALMAAIAGRRVAAICCTHTHFDHSPLAAPLKDLTGAPVIGCAGLALDTKGDVRLDAGFDKTYQPDQVLAHGESISGPGWTLSAVHTPGHTANHLCFALEETGALFTGDHVMGWSTSVIAPPDGDMADYMASLQLLHDREDRVYYPAHGEQVDNPRQLVRGMIGHRRQRERQVLRQLEKGPQAIIDMVPEMYKGTNPVLYPAAGMSVKAHLLDLARRGMVGQDGELWQLAD